MTDPVQPFEPLRDERFISLCLYKMFIYRAAIQDMGAGLPPEDISFNDEMLESVQKDNEEIVFLLEQFATEVAGKTRPGQDYPGLTTEHATIAAYTYMRYKTHVQMKTAEMTFEKVRDVFLKHGYTGVTEDMLENINEEIQLREVERTQVAEDRFRLTAHKMGLHPSETELALPILRICSTTPD